MIIKPFIAVGVLMLLAACTSGTALPTVPADPAVVARIVAACTADGVFKSVGGRLVLGAVPYAGQADAIVAAGIDRICANPETAATDLATAEQVAKNIAGQIRAIIARSRPAKP